MKKKTPKELDDISRKKDEQAKKVTEQIKILESKRSKLHTEHYKAKEEARILRMLDLTNQHLYFKSIRKYSSDNINYIKVLGKSGTDSYPYNPTFIVISIYCKTDYHWQKFVIEQRSYERQFVIEKYEAIEKEEFEEIFKQTLEGLQKINTKD